jgi:hypothetical protein
LHGRGNTVDEAFGSRCFEDVGLLVIHARVAAFSWYGERRYWSSDSALIIEVQLAFQLMDSQGEEVDP